MKMRAGYVNVTKFLENQSPVDIIVFNYDFYNKPCEVVSHVIGFKPEKKGYVNALGIWKVKLKTKKK